MREMERKTRLARLIVAAPQMVFAELKAYSADLKGPPYTIPDEDMEAALAERNNPLIDLRLASYGGSPSSATRRYLMTVPASLSTHSALRKLLM